MANRLLRTHQLGYIPGTPYVPGVPAYCMAEVTTDSLAVSGGSVGTSSSGVVITIGTADNGETFMMMTGQPAEVTEPSVTTTSVCYDEVPEIPSTPGTIAYSIASGWDGAGRSIDPMVGDGAFQFYVSANAVGVVAGLVPGDDPLLFQSSQFAFYVHNGVIDILELGTVVATVPATHDYQTPLYISRAGTRVFYTYGDWTYESAVAATTDPLYLGAVIYLSGDYVDSPALLPGPYYGVGDLDAALPLLSAYATDATSYAELRADLPSLTPSIGGTSGRVGELSGTLPIVAAMLGDTLGTGQLLASLSRVTADFGGGLPEFTVGTLVAQLPPISGYLRGMTGGTGTLEGTLPPLATMFTDRDNYGQLAGTLQPVSGYLLTRADVGYGRADNSLLVIGDYWKTYQRHRAVLRDSLQLVDSWTLTLVINGVLNDALMLSDRHYGYRLLQAVIRSGLLLGGSTGDQTAPMQYAVNVLTSALTTYDGMDFDGFALADGVTYAYRADGVYKLRPGDDNGSPVSVYVDFGSSDYGSVMAKTVEAVYLGLTTDGEVRVAVKADGRERVYRVIQRGPLMRVSGAKGETAREWNMTLQVAEATDFYLDAVEHVVGVSTRRWIR